MMQSTTSSRPPLQAPSEMTSVTWRWYMPNRGLALVFCLCWDGFLVLWYEHALRHPTSRLGLLLSLGHLAIGLGMSYATLASYVNRTTLRIEGDELVLQHGPLPWPGNRRMPLPAGGMRPSG